jgi:hypothetical protein
MHPTEERLPNPFDHAIIVAICAAAHEETCTMIKRTWTPRYTVTMGLHLQAHDWLRSQVARLTGDDRRISRVVESLVQDRIDLEQRREEKVSVAE